jgi:hypothetical protein
LMLCTGVGPRSKNTPKTLFLDRRLMGTPLHHSLALQ